MNDAAAGQAGGVGRAGAAGPAGRVHAASGLGRARASPGVKEGSAGQAEASVPSQRSSRTRWASRSNQATTVASSRASSGDSGLRSSAGARAGGVVSNGSWSAPPDGGGVAWTRIPPSQLGHRAARQHEPHPAGRAERGHPPLPPERAGQRAGPVPHERRLLEPPGLGQLGQPPAQRLEEGVGSGRQPLDDHLHHPAVRLGLARSRARAQGHAELRGQARVGAAREGGPRAERLGAAPQRRHGLDGLDHGRGVLGRREGPEVERAVGPRHPHHLEPGEALAEREGDERRRPPARALAVVAGLEPVDEPGLDDRGLEGRA